MRTKEEAHDYRYFPDPDLMEVRFTPEEIEAIRVTLPELPEAMRRRMMQDYGISRYDAEVLTQDQDVANWFDRAAGKSRNPKQVANWTISELLRLLGESKIDIADCKIQPEQLAGLVDLIAAGTINNRIGKDVFSEMFQTGTSADVIVKEKGLAQVNDDGAVAAFVDQAIAANPAQVEQYKAGNAKVLQFLMGQVMKISKGKANPQSVMALLKEKLQ